VSRSLVSTRRWSRLARLHEVFGFVLILQHDIWSEISVVTPTGRRTMKSTDLGQAVDALYDVLVDEDLIPCEAAA
jgi:hypothetical protein